MTSRLLSRPSLLLFLAGASLTLAQYAVLQETATLVGSNEVVSLLVLGAYFLGLSLGYLVSDSLGRRSLIAIGACTLALHCTLPFSARYVAGTFARWNLGGNIPPFVFLLVLFGVSPFYAVFLPRVIDRETGPSGMTLARLYATELLGGFAGLMAAVVLTPARIEWVLALNAASLSALVLLAVEPRSRAAFGLPVLFAAGTLGLHAKLETPSIEYFYRWAHDFDAPELLASELSPYQRIDLVNEGHGPTARPFLYLNGNLLFGNKKLNQHNLFVSMLPNLLRSAAPAQSLVLGGGSLDSARYLAPRVGRLRVVELDGQVVALTRRHIQEPRGNFPSNWDLTLDDGKHFLGTYEGAPFDVISVDIPVPAHLQTALMHSERFFRLAHSRLREGGVFSVSLSGEYGPGVKARTDFLESDLPNRIMAGLLRAFRHVTVVTAEGRSYAWASDADLGLTEALVREKLTAFFDTTASRDYFGDPKFALMDDAKARAQADGFEPIGEADMQLVLRVSLRKLYYRYYEHHR
jgi:spermidine synthase